MRTQDMTDAEYGYLARTTDMAVEMMWRLYRTGESRDALEYKLEIYHGRLATNPYGERVRLALYKMIARTNRELERVE